MSFHAPHVHKVFLGDKGRQDPREGGHTIHNGRQWETRGDKTLGKADTPSNTGTDNGRQGETLGDKGTQGDTRGHKGTQGETRPSGRRTHHPTQAHMWGRQWETRGDETLRKADTPSNTGTHMGRQWETSGDKGRQGETRPSGRRTHHPTQARMWGNSGRQGRQGETRPSGRADTPSNTKADTLESIKNR